MKRNGVAPLERPGRGTCLGEGADKGLKELLYHSRHEGNKEEEAEDEDQRPDLRDWVAGGVGSCTESKHLST